ncbi:hypothetical protein YC2023_017365 [Brassica napus]
MSLKRFVRPILPKAKGKEEGLSQMLHQIFCVLKRVWQLVKLDNLPGSTRQSVEPLRKSQQPLQNLEKHKVGEPSETTVTNEPDGKSEYAHSQDQHGETRTRLRSLVTAWKLELTAVS